MLDVISNTDNEEMTTSVQRIVYTYHEQLMPIALELATRVLDAFKGIALCSSDEAEDKMAAAMGLLTTMYIILVGGVGGEAGRGWGAVVLFIILACFDLMVNYWCSKIVAIRIWFAEVFLAECLPSIL